MAASVDVACSLYGIDPKYVDGLEGIIGWLQQSAWKCTSHGRKGAKDGCKEECKNKSSTSWCK